MTCKFCGAELPAGAYKCDMCGQNIRAKKTATEGGMFGDVLMTAPTEYKSVPMKEPSKLPKIIAIVVAALVVIVGAVIAFMIFLKPKKPVDQFIDSFFKTGALDSMEFTYKTMENGVEVKTTGYYEFDSKEKEARLFLLDEKRENIKLFIFTPTGSYIVNQVDNKVYAAKNGGNFEGDEYAVYFGDANFYLLERNQETGPAAYDAIMAMRKDNHDDFYVAVAKLLGQYSNENLQEDNDKAVAAIKTALDTIKADLRDTDKQKSIFGFSSDNTVGLDIKFEPDFTSILTYGLQVVGGALDEEMSQSVQMIAALAALSPTKPSVALSVSLTGGKISNCSLSVTQETPVVTSISIQNMNKTEIPARADEFYKAYTKNK